MYNRRRSEIYVLESKRVLLIQLDFCFAAGDDLALSPAMGKGFADESTSGLREYTGHGNVISHSLCENAAPAEGTATDGS